MGMPTNCQIAKRTCRFVASSHRSPQRSYGRPQRMRPQSRSEAKSVDVRWSTPGPSPFIDLPCSLIEQIGPVPSHLTTPVSDAGPKDAISPRPMALCRPIRSRGSGRPVMWPQAVIPFSEVPGCPC
jgi:hypothetical protein